MTITSEHWIYCDTDGCTTTETTMIADYGASSAVPFTWFEVRPGSASAFMLGPMFHACCPQHLASSAADGYRAYTEMLRRRFPDPVASAYAATGRERPPT